MSNILRKITELIDDSNEQQRRTSASIQCEDPFSSATPYTEEPRGGQNRVEDRYEEEAYSCGRDEEGQHVFYNRLDSPDVPTKTKRQPVGPNANALIPNVCMCSRYIHLNNELAT